MELEKKKEKTKREKRPWLGINSRRLKTGEFDWR